MAKALISEPECFSNPSSIHLHGQRAKAIFAKLKELLVRELGRSDTDEIILTSGATEAVNLALRSFIKRYPEGVVVTSTIEHSAVNGTLEETQTNAIRIGVDQKGQLDREHLFSVLNDLNEKKIPAALSLQLVNNETGLSYLSDELLTQLRQLRSKQKLFILIDGAQALGKLSPTVLRRVSFDADTIALSAHKMGGPTGVGALWVHPNFPLVPQVTGGPQERRRRGGTQNSLGTFGWLSAMSFWAENGEAIRSNWKEHRLRLIGILQEIPGFTLHTPVDLNDFSIHNTINFHIVGCPEEGLLLALDLEGFQLSAGSACNSGSLKPSPVLLAQGWDEDVAYSSLRLSFGAENTWEDLEKVGFKIKELVDRIQMARQRSLELLGQL